MLRVILRYLVRPIVWGALVLFASLILAAMLWLPRRPDVFDRKHE